MRGKGIAKRIEPLFTLAVIFLLAIWLSGPANRANAQDAESSWDYDPYRVMIWVVGPDGSPLAETLAPPLKDFLDREFSAIWRTDVRDAPEIVRIAAARDIDSLTFERLTAADPIVAVKRNHLEAPRIRIARDVGTRVKACKATAKSIAEVTARGQAVENADLDGVAKILQPIDGSVRDVVASWADESTEAVLLPRGIAATLQDPEPKLIPLNVSDLVIDVFGRYDKIFVVRLDSRRPPASVQAVEIDCLMRLTGPVVTLDVLRPSEWISGIGRAVVRSFAPTVRIEDVGTQWVMGRVRAGGLIVNPDSPGAIGEEDLLQPAVRKDDRNGDPIMLEKLDWAYLDVDSIDGAKVKMKLYAGRAGGLQGRRNSRTHRMAFKVRPYYPKTVIRLHAQGRPDEPLQGYEFHEKDLESGEFTFLGRTDWEGRFPVSKTENPLRLLYVKNGGAILAKLPTVPGQEAISVADLSGDDVRLEAEAFVRGIQNAIIDLVALRDLYAARIRLRIEKGEIDTAREMLNALRDLPSKDALSAALDSRLQQYDKLAKGGQAAMIEKMFTQTRQMLSKHISPRVIRELETEVAAAEAGRPQTARRVSESEDGASAQ